MRFWLHQLPDEPADPNTVIVFHLCHHPYERTIDAMCILLMSLCSDRDASDLFSGTEDSTSRLLDGYRRTLEIRHHPTAVARGYGLNDLDAFLRILSYAILQGQGLAWGPETGIRDPVRVGTGLHMTGPESAG